MGRYLTLFFSSAGHFIESQTGPWDEAGPAEASPEIRHRDDVYTEEFLRWLLKKVGITEGDWILRRVDAGRILLVCSYALHKEALGQAKAGPRAIALAAFRDGYDVPDVRNQVIPRICTRPQRDAAPEELPLLQAAEEEDRRTAQGLLAAFLADLKRKSAAGHGSDSGGFGRN